MGRRVNRELTRKMSVMAFVRSALLQYVQIRCVYERGNYWSPELAECSAPPF